MKRPRWRRNDRLPGTSRRFGVTSFRVGVLCPDISSPISWRIYVNVQRVTLKLEYHSSSGKDASTMSNHAKEWGCIHTSLKHGGFRQPRIACSKAYCHRFNAFKSGARDDLVSSLKCDRRFRFFKATSHTMLFVLENLPFNKLTSVFPASVLLLIMNFVITLSK